MSSNPIRRAGLLLLAVIVLRIVFVYFVFTLGLNFPWRIPTFILCLPIILIAALALQSKQKLLLLTAVTFGSSLIFTAYDLQFLPLPERSTSFASLTGYESGFLAGFLLAMAVIFLLGLELRKSIQIQGEWWRGKICWAAAGISLWLSIYSLVAN